MTTLRIATRRSALATAQARAVAAAIEAAAPGVRTVLVFVSTEGDRDRATPLSGLGGAGVFTRAIQEAVLRGEADLAVHSLKDLPLDGPADLVLAAVFAREDVRDALVSRGGLRLADLPPGARIGSSSPRREFQVRALAAQLGRADLRIEPVRGNVPTRVRKAEAGKPDAVVLALAGLRRLGLESKASQVFTLDEILPAPGQGAIAIEAMAGSEAARHASAIDETSARAAVLAERAALGASGGGCHAAFAAHATVAGKRLRLRVRVPGAEGAPPCETEAEGPASDPEALGREAAGRLLSR